MDAKILKGKAFGKSLGGIVVNLNHDDASSIIGATSGFLKKIFAAGKWALGGAILASLVGGLGEKKKTAINEYCESKITKRNIPIGQWLIAHASEKKRFLGFCLDENISFTCEEQVLSTSLSCVSLIIKRDEELDWSDTITRIKTIDGSEFKATKVKTMKFASIAGVINVDINEEDENLMIYAVTPNDVTKLREALKKSLQFNRQELIKLLGEDIVGEYYILE